MNKRKYKNYLWGYFFVAPTIIGLLILNIYPIFKTLLLSFSTSTGFEEYVFSGLNNFTRVLKDREVWIGLRNTLIFSAVSVPGGIFISLLLAWLMSKEIRGRSVYRVIYFTPMVAAPAAVTMVWAWLYNSEFGFLNYVIKSLGGATHSWLHDPKYALMSVIIIAIWGGLGQQIIILIVAITNVPRVYYEAAEIDGARKWKQLLHVTIPGISTMIIMMLIMRMGAVFSVGADKILLLYSPANYEFSDVINTYVYRMGMTQADYGLSTAVGLFNSVIGTIMLITTNQITKKLSGTAMF